MCSANAAQFAVEYHPYGIGKGARFIEIVRHKHNGAIKALVNVFKRLVHSLFCNRVERRKRFIQKQQ